MNYIKLIYTQINKYTCINISKIMNSIIIKFLKILLAHGILLLKIVLVYLIARQDLPIRAEIFSYKGEAGELVQPKRALIEKAV